ncbi:uncharacterized protein MEPE_02083 [Melanopsichium pennsylvanicum]|uniref:Uncharacterized protein n=2 Tax=Melanopsichium pennsylvanicum TaxID=63383 RepID=A0AAJ4XK10_9BASI|nr:conserved hypothetical protein [Melanopsichium pennsylvanicum 4]SNX83376.1 uncharacterized protein MEPE_02083 [Melanopsichium pennsylvanicum]
MNAFPMMRLVPQACRAASTAEARLGLSMARMPQQIRTYYGKRIDPRTRFFDTASRAARPRIVAASASSSSSGSTAHMGLMLAGGSFIAAAGLSAFTSASVQCESARPYANPSASTAPVSVSTKDNNTTTISTEPQSIINVYQLSFGTICGVCAGVFIKKGLKLIAFLLGGCYILLQYLNSQKLVQVNWSAINSKYDKLVGSAAGPETASNVRGYSGSTLQRIWNRTTNFLMADFQPRATFMAGLVLGLRLG